MTAGRRARATRRRRTSTDAAGGGQGRPDMIWGGGGGRGAAGRRLVQGEGGGSLDFPLASARSGVIRRSWVLLSRTQNAAVSYRALGVAGADNTEWHMPRG